jgi:MFS family permease
VNSKLNSKNRILAGIASGAAGGVVFVIAHNIKSYLTAYFFWTGPRIPVPSDRPITSFLPVISIIILYFAILGFIISLVLVKVKSKWGRLGIWGGVFSPASIAIIISPILVMGRIDQALFYQWLIFDICYLAIVGGLTGFLAGLIFNKLVPLEQTSKKRTKRNRKAVIGILIPFIPILAAMTSFLIRSVIMYDVDLPILGLILISPVFFVIGAVISAISFKGSEGKILPIIGLILNVIFLFFGIYILMNVRM